MMNKIDPKGLYWTWCMGTDHKTKMTGKELLDHFKNYKGNFPIVDWEPILGKHGY